MQLGRQDKFANVTLPAGAPAWITVEVLTDTLESYQPLYTEPMTVDEALGILINFGNVLSVLKGDGREKVKT